MADKEYLVLTAIGPDRPGLVNTLSRYVYDRGGNVEASRAATLGGEFAFIMLVSGAPDACGSIQADTEQLVHGAHLMCSTRPTTAPQEHRPIGRAMPYSLTVHSMDHPGIVRAVAAELSEMGVNIVSMETHVESAPHTGTDFFHLHARLDVPAELRVTLLRQRLDDLAEKLNVDIALAVDES